MKLQYVDFLFTLRSPHKARDVRVFCDFQISICNKQSEKSRVKLLYVDFPFCCYITFLSIRPVMLLWFVSPINPGVGPNIASHVSPATVLSAFLTPVSYTHLTLPTKVNV